MNMNEWTTREGGLVVPSDEAADQTPADPESVRKLEEDLHASRLLDEVKRWHRLTQLAGRIRHRAAVRSVRAAARDARTAAKADRDITRMQAAETNRAMVAAANVTALYRRTAALGTQATVASQFARSGEMRAARLARIKRVIYAVLIPVIVAFAAWSTPGVHAGVVRVLALAPGSAAWWGAWLLEPALMAVVIVIIAGKSALVAVGGGVTTQIVRTKWLLMAISITLNLAGGWTTGLGVAATVAAALAHSIGPIGAALGAYLLGALIDCANAADPWDGAPSLADMGLTVDVEAAGQTMSQTMSGHNPDAGRPLSPAQLQAEERHQQLVEDVKAAITAGRLDRNPGMRAVFRGVMGGRGSKDRAGRAAAAVAGWDGPDDGGRALKIVGG